MTEIELFDKLNPKRDLPQGTCDVISRVYEVMSKEDAPKWHYPSKGNYPSLQDLPDGGDYNPLVLVFWWSSDDYGHKAKVYGLDRWIPETKVWEDYNRRNIIAWQYLPEPPNEEL